MNYGQSVDSINKALTLKYSKYTHSNHPLPLFNKKGELDVKDNKKGKQTIAQHWQRQ